MDQVKFVEDSLPVCLSCFSIDAVNVSKSVKKYQTILKNTRKKKDFKLFCSVNIVFKCLRWFYFKFNN